VGESHITYTDMLTLEDITAAKIGILGFGKEGQAVANFLHRHGLTATVFDNKKTRTDFPAEQLAGFEQQGFAFELGKDFGDFSGCAVLFRSPGIPRLSPAIVAAESRGVIITSQTKWFFDYCPARIIGVTGTKGKGTTVSLIARILQAAHLADVTGPYMKSSTKIYVTGNIGKQDPLDILPELSSDDIVVFELSSFQLQDLTRSPWAGVCLMVTQEHLDHHTSVEEYQHAKSSIIAHQSSDDIAIYSDDYPASIAIGQSGKGHTFAYSRFHSVRSGVYAEGEQIHIAGMPTSGDFTVADRLLRGAHNLENICAAVAVGASVGVPLEVLAQAIKEFPGLEHRLEFVGEYEGVSFYNDSISTVPESSIAALQAFEEPKIIILGGSEKGSDFIELGKVVAASNMRGVILIGDMTERLAAALQQAGNTALVVSGARSMSEIFAQIAGMAQTGDVVLLSPACASFGIFKNYQDRGEQFKAAARQFRAFS
jgi:UDP-N-acetylmuramoylalanine--D-glutamate ligase